MRVESVFLGLTVLIACGQLKKGFLQTRAEKSVGCFGSAGFCLYHNLTCSATERVAITRAVYGHKKWVNCTTGVISCGDSCCEYNSNDCFTLYQAEDVKNIYRNCSDHECHFRTARTVSLCQDFQHVSNYDVIDYECVDESTIVPMCASPSYITGKSVSIMYDPRKQYMLSSDTCYCTMWHSGNNLVSVEEIDIRLRGSSGTCAFLSMYDLASFRLYHCETPSTWANGRIIARTWQSYFTLNMTGLSDFVWIRFTASKSINVACSLNNRHTMPPTTAAPTTELLTTQPPTTTKPPTEPPTSTMKPTTEPTTRPPTTPDTTLQVTDPETPVPSSASITINASTVPPITGNTSSTDDLRSTPQTGGQKGETDTNLVPIIVGVVGGVIVIALLIAVIVCCKRSAKEPSDSRQLVSSGTKNGAVYDNHVVATVPGKDMSMYNTAMYDNVKVTKPAAESPHMMGIPEETGETTPNQALAKAQESNHAYETIQNNAIEHKYDSLPSPSETSAQPEPTNEPPRQILTMRL